MKGIDLDPQTRCAHWRSPRDIIAIKMRCCGLYWACRDCHDALADHPAQVWSVDERAEPAILCGACGELLTIAAYLGGDSRCPACAAPFNPGCKTHNHFYFAGD